MAFVKRFHARPSFLCLTNDLNFIIDRGSQADRVFLDFSKTFDKVPHGLLMPKLARFNTYSSVLDIDNLFPY